MCRSIQFASASFAALLATMISMQSIWAEPVRLSGHLQVLLVMDTDATNISDGVQADLKLLIAVLNEVRAEHREKISISVMKGAEVTPENVIAHYKSLHKKDEDSLLFIYSGHGGLDPIQGQFLAMRRGNLVRSNLRNAMDQTNSGLRVILTDCCSNIAGVDPPNRRIPAAWEGFKNLFFQHRGLVDITAASDQTFAWTNSNGGYFTQCLARLFCEPIESTDENRDGFVTWDEFSSVLSKDTNALFLQSRRNAEIANPAPDHISHFASQIPKTCFTGFCNWEQASTHEQLRAVTWESEALLYGYATYQLLDPTKVNPRGADAKLRQTAPYAAAASTCFGNAVNHQSRAIHFEKRYGTIASTATLARRKAEFERQANSYNTVARRMR